MGFANVTPLLDIGSSRGAGHGGHNVIGDTVPQSIPQLPGTPDGGASTVQSSPAPLARRRKVAGRTIPPPGWPEGPPGAATARGPHVQRVFLGGGPWSRTHWRVPDLRDVPRCPIVPALALTALALVASFATLPAAAATPPAYTGTEGEPIALDVTADAGGPVANWSWDFEGDGTWDWNSTAGPNTTHVYASPGTLNAVLEARLQNGTVRSWTYQVLVRPRDQPPAVAIVKGPDGYIASDRLTPVALDGLAVDADGTVVLYEWDFDGDGAFDWSSPTSARVSHTYTALGNFTSLLRATDDGGQRGTDRVQVLVRNLPPDLRGPSNLTTDSRGVDVSVTASDPDGSVVLFTWDFGDGRAPVRTTAPSASHDYGAVGLYTVRVEATDNDGGSSTTVSWVNITPPVGRDPPTVDAGPDVTVRVNGTVHFAAVASNGTGSIVRYEWDLDGDGRSDVEGPDQTHAFSTPGAHTVKLWVFDDIGFVVSDTRNVTVLPEVDLLPVPVPSVEQWVAPGKPLAFADGSYDPDGRIVLWQWDFDGDGRFDFASDRGGNATHTYAEVGKYAAVLRVTDDRGMVNSTTIPIEVSTDAPGTERPSDTKGAAVCCGAILVVLVITSYWTLRRSLASPRKDRHAGGGPPGGDDGPGGRPPEGQGPPRSD